MQQYPKIIEQSLKSLTDFCKVVSRYRDEDITDRNTFPAVFLKARKVGKVPLSSADVEPTDKLNDMNWDANYLYILVDDTGAAWRRTALSSW